MTSVGEIAIHFRSESSLSSVPGSYLASRGKMTSGEFELPVLFKKSVIDGVPLRRFMGTPIQTDGDAYRLA